MALRSRTRTATAGSGPGRGPASDGRTRHRRPPVRSRTRHRHASADELRRRAESLLSEPGGEWGESGKGPPGRGVGAGGSSGGVAADSDVSYGGAAASRDVLYGGAAAHSDVLYPGGPDPEASRVAGRRERVGAALRERMPVWLQARCGLERRNVLALTVLLVVAAVFAVQHFWAGRTQSVKAPEVVRAAAPYEEGGAGGADGEPVAKEGDPAASAGAPDAVGTPGAEIVVDVSGKVRDPGIHSLPAGSRVADALRAAGGVRPGTNTDGLNRARFLVDGEQVVVGGPAPVQGPGAGGAATGGTAGAAPSAPVFLNTATVEQLDTLPGVGPVLAQHIIDYRTQHGGFRSVDELRDVNGIGERRFADLRNLVRP
ncbi:ComEA family DNA-binding protein [Streptomyces sp. HUCO-GS316]|uniref:ComEA family DNA-binding protein n=1 Tax=Streptomyces sp. HUCO-GS316 TaxID=2692198 RepID=UPI0013FF11A2|nr:ComEA family DNA-binding protein [Streptomyces sp. HUCO-GS316]MXM61997.1 ComEA family DNA-binding protein [Streptomyces sp. HUCO-GS316]